MARRCDMRGILFILVAVLALTLARGGLAAEDSTKQQVERQATQPLNNAPYWRDVRKGENPNQVTQVRGIETNILVQTEGQFWRELRNGPITIYGGWLLVVVFLAIALFFWWKGSIKLRRPPTGRRIPRFTPYERLLHWTTATSFVILALSGIVMLFGKYVLLPVFGYTLFSWLAILGKNLHNFVGPLFVACTVLMLLKFARDNLPRVYDLKWLPKLGGLLSGEHVPSGKFNAGEKLWFWGGVVVLGIVMSASGLVLDFPNFAQGREMMQQANVIHAVAAVLFMAMGLGHIYLGTIGLEGAYDSMHLGSVDEEWAKEHHEYWYNEMMAKKGRTGSGAPAGATASSMREGWKL